MERNVSSDRFPIGSTMPAFRLPNVDGQIISNDYFKGSRLALVVFTCNHCPYVKGSELNLLKVVNEFAPAGLKTVTISANDATQYPEDSFEKMKEHARSEKLPYPYLYDESQAVARSFDAACTPECYLFDETMKLIFHGTINDNPKDPSAAKQQFLRTAVSQALEGEPVNPAFVHPIGCSIKWRT